MRNYTPVATYHEEVALPDDGDERGEMGTFGPGYEGALDNAAAARAAAIAAQAGLDDLIANGFPFPSWPKLKDGTGDDEGEQREVEIWQPFLFTDLLDSTFGGPGDHWLDGFDAGGPANYGTSKGPGNTRAAYLRIARPINGNKLKSARLHLTTPSGHAAIPTSLPTVELCKTSTTFGNVPDVLAGPAGPDVSGISTGAEWDGYWAINLLCDTTINLNLGAYFLRVTDEHGSDSIAGTRYWGAMLTYVVTEIRL